MPGVMSWESMNWLFPDFEQTGLIYHGTRTEHLSSIFQKGLISRFKVNPEEKYETIYDTLYRHRPPSIPQWVDPTRCIFGHINRERYPVHRVIDGTIVRATLGIALEEHVANRTWTGIIDFSHWIYCPKEAGFFDTEARAEHYHSVVEPVCAGAYWKMSMSFQDNLKIRLDHFLRAQGRHELLICLERIGPEFLSLQALIVQGLNGKGAVLRQEKEDLFSKAESRLRLVEDIDGELKAIAEYASKR